MSKRDELISILKQTDEQHLILFIKKCNSEGKGCLTELLTSCSKKQLDLIWTGILKTLKPTLSVDTQQPVPENPEQKVVDGVDGLVHLVSASISLKERYIPDGLLQAMTVLQGMLTVLPEREDKLKNSVAMVMEDWWKKKLTNGDGLIINAFVYILERSLDFKPKPLVKDVKRVWALHEVLLLVELSDESSSVFREMLLRCYQSRLYLQHDEGIRFLSFVLSLNADFMSVIHKEIKTRLLSVSRSWWEIYGEVYFGALQRVEGPLKEKLELQCIQDLMHHAVHAQRSLFPALKKLLGYIHRQKKKQAVEDMLCRLYEPFLWRSLRVANSDVRANAADLFFSVFPLQNSELNAEESDQLLQKQFDMFEVLLYDPFPSIRSLAVLGVFSIMRDYWEMIPADTLRNLMTRLVKDLLMDTASTDVRESVLKGFTCLLDNPLCRPFLKTILPQIQNSFHDPSDRVRVAMMELLLKVKGLSTIKYWSIIPLEHLLARLAVDCDPVNKRIVELIISSFMPLDASSAVKIDRLTVLIQSNPAAARQVFRYAPKHLDVAETVGYITTICRSILVKIQNGEECSDSEAAEKETTEEEDSSSRNITLGMVEGIVILWSAIGSNLTKASNAQLKKALEKKFCYALPVMMKAYSDPEIQSALIQITGHLPPSFIPTISRTYLPKLRNLDTGTKASDYSDILEALCLWGHAGGVLELASDWLKPFLVPAQEVAAKKPKKRVGFVEPQPAKPQLGLDFLACLLELQHCQDILLRDNAQDWQQIADILRGSMDRISERLGGHGHGPPTPDVDDSFLLSSLSLYCQINMLLHPRNQDLLTRTFNEVLTWTSECLSPWIQKVQDEEMESENGSPNKESGYDDAHRHRFAMDVTKRVLELFSDLFLIGLGTEGLCSQIAEFCTACICADQNLVLLECVLKCLYQSTEFIKFSTETQSGNHGNHINSIPEALTKIFVAIAAYVKQRKPNDIKVLNAVKGHLLELIQAVFQATWIDENVLQDILATIVATIMAELGFCSNKLDLEGKELPPLTSWLVDILQKKKHLLRLFVKEVTCCMESGAVTDLHSLHGVIHLTQALANGAKIEAGGLKELWTHTSTAVEKYHNNTSEDIGGVDEEVLKEARAKVEECRQVFN